MDIRGVLIKKNTLKYLKNIYKKVLNEKKSIKREKAQVSLFMLILLI